LADKGIGKVCPMLVIGSRTSELKFDECVSDGDFSYNTKEIKFVSSLPILNIFSKKNRKRWRIKKKDHTKYFNEDV
jgi:hypothetical protein